MKFMTFAFCLAFAVSAADANDFSISVDDRFSEDEITWQGDVSGNAYVFVFDIRAKDGWLYLCGAGKFTDPTLRNATRNILRSSFLEYNGKKVLKDISYFATVPFQNDLKSAKATCRATTVPSNVRNGDFTLQVAGGNFRM